MAGPLPKTLRLVSMAKSQSPLVANEKSPSLGCFGSRGLSYASDHSGETPMPEVVPWTEALGLPKRLDAQATEIESLRGELEQMRREHAAFYAQVVDSLARAGLPPPGQARTPDCSAHPHKRR